MSKKILYFDCFSGISGDMVIGSLLDLGASKKNLISKLEKLKLSGYKLEINKEIKNGITGTKFDVILDKQDHHSHDHSHSHNKEHHHRTYIDIIQIIKNSDLSDPIKEKSSLIFKYIGEAEAKIHGKKLEEVHFHEVGAIDSIVDIIGAAICLEDLNVDEVISSPIHLGSGSIKCDHGIFPVPAPATLEILKGVPVYSKQINGELTTPTGAGIIKSFTSNFTGIPQFEVEKIGYGLGTKTFIDHPNLLRVILGKKEKKKEKNWILETNIDDMNSEIYSYLFKILFNAGANDVFLTNIIMKKNRPGIKLSVLVRESLIEEIEKIIFLETTTLGIRRYPIDKSILNKKFETLKTPMGDITLKHGFYKDKLVKTKAEYEDCRKIAEEKNIPLKDVYSKLIKYQNIKESEYE